MAYSGRRRIRVRVRPRSRKRWVREEESGEFTVSVHSPPDKGRANEEVLELLAGHFGLPASSFRLLGGLRSRVKLVEFRERDERL